MAPKAIVGKLSRVNILAICGLQRLNALLKLASVDVGEKVIGLVLAL